jgi:hypothetical protein
MMRVMVYQLPIDVNGRLAVVRCCQTAHVSPQPGRIPCLLTGQFMAPPPHTPPKTDAEIAQIRAFFARLAQNKDECIAFLKSAGILDKKGALAAPYRGE